MPDHTSQKSSPQKTLKSFYRAASRRDAAKALYANLGEGSKQCQKKTSTRRLT